MCCCTRLRIIWLKLRLDVQHHARRLYDVVKNSFLSSNFLAIAIPIWKRASSPDIHWPGPRAFTLDFLPLRLHRQSPLPFAVWYTPHRVYTLFPIQLAPYSVSFPLTLYYFAFVPFSDLLWSTCPPAVPRQALALKIRCTGKEEAEWLYVFVSLLMFGIESRWRQECVSYFSLVLYSWEEVVEVCVRLTQCACGPAWPGRSPWFFKMYDRTKEV